MPSPSDIRKLPITISFDALYRILFQPQSTHYESVEVTEEVAQEILDVDPKEDLIHLEHTEDDKLFAWRREAWVVNAERIIRQKAEDNERRRLGNLKDEAIQKMAAAILKKTGRGKQFEEASVQAARIVMQKKDRMLAMMLGDVDLDSEEWKDLIK